MRYKREFQRLKSAPSGMKLVSLPRDFEVDARLMEGPDFSEEYLMIRVHQTDPEFWTYYVMDIAKGGVISMRGAVTDQQAFKYTMEAIEYVEERRTKRRDIDAKI